jgi:predicted AAA+ superfamily ATPase
VPTAFPSRARKLLSSQSRGRSAGFVDFKGRISRDLSYYRNASRSLKKNPKVYFYDTGLCCFLQSISEHEELLKHRNLGAIFETLVFGQIYKKISSNAHLEKLYFYRDSQGREVDFIIEKAGKNFGS